ncbi:hypothetical protein CO660_04565 [Rhizobium sp. L9]|nr:hypothetical protein CO660_04565 [Rhizobium sp. L9]
MLTTVKLMKLMPCGPLIRPTGTFSRLGEEGIETSRHVPFSPAGRRWPEGSDEGAARADASYGICPISGSSGG